MLTNHQSYLRYHQQALLQSWQMLWQKPVTFFMTVTVMAVIFLLPACLWFMLNNLGPWTGQWKQSGHILLYLKPALSSAQQQATLEQVQGVLGVETANMTTPAEGLLAMEKQAGMQGIHAYLADNPLPAVIEVTPSGQLQTATAVEQLFSHLADFSAVDTAQFDQDWIQRVYSAVQVMAHFSIIFSGFLSFLVVLIVTYTLRFVLQEKRAEIEILSLVGAPFAYILRPFLYAGLLYGLGAALLALLMLQGVTMYVIQYIQQWMHVYHMDYPLQVLSAKQQLIFLTIALCLAWLGARFAVVRNIVFFEANV